MGELASIHEISPKLTWTPGRQISPQELKVRKAV